MRESRRWRTGSRRRGRSIPKGVDRPERVLRWHSGRIAQLIGGFSHNPDCLLRCMRNCETDEIDCIHKAVSVYEQAASFYKLACSSEFLRDIPWSKAVTLYSLSDEIRHGTGHPFNPEPGHHYVHRCSFGIGDHALPRVFAHEAHAFDQNTCHIKLDLYSHIGDFRGPATLHHIDVAEVREVMCIQLEIKLGDRVISESTLMGCSISADDLVVDNPSDLFSFQSSIHAHRGYYDAGTPQFAREFTQLVHCLLRNLVGKKWGVAAHEVLSQLIFTTDGHECEERPQGELLRVVKQQHQHHQHDRRVMESSDSDSEFECCEARWYAIEHISSDAKISKIIFQYVQDPEEIWSRIRHHLARSEVAALKRGIGTLRLASKFYRTARSTGPLHSIPWIDQVSVTHVSSYVGDEIKGSHECSFKCDFDIDSNNRIFKCSLAVVGNFTRGPNRESSRSCFPGGTRWDSPSGCDRKRARSGGRNIFAVKLYIGGNVGKVIQGSKIDRNCIAALVQKNRTSLRAVCQDLTGGSKMEIFSYRFSRMLFELFNTTSAFRNFWGREDVKI